MTEVALSIDGAPVCVPAEADVLWAESCLGFSLPDSYVEYVSRWGRAVLSGLIYVFVPTESVPDNIVVGQSQRKAMLSDIDAGIAELDPDGSVSLAERFIMFGISFNGHRFAWDGASKSDDPGVYVVGENALGVRSVGVGFSGFMDGVCAQASSQLLGPSYEPLRPQLKPLPIKE
ncbi:MAG: hypothetical protein EVA89_00480 [Sandaracinaceae bacterium]|nr:MAG: hypothetical protein EVA89_00480 [Sandaracinaceae bacterium]